jgi:hypothetical protein
MSIMVAEIAREGRVVRDTLEVQSIEHGFHALLALEV